jgi:hypothetical protein
MRVLRLSGLSIFIGYLAVIAGTIALIVAFRTYHQKGYLVTDIAMTVAYGLVGVGCWRSVRACRDGDTSARMMRSVTRWVGAASGAMAVAFAGQTYDYNKVHSSIIANGGSEPRYALQIFGGLALVVGFLLAGVGFWFASNRFDLATEPTQIPVPDSSTVHS